MSNNNDAPSMVNKVTDHDRYSRSSSLSPSTRALLDEVAELNRLCSSAVGVASPAEINEPIAADSSSGSSQVSTSTEQASTSSLRRSTRSRRGINRTSINMSTSPTGQRSDEVINISDLSVTFSEPDDDVVYVSTDIIDLCTPKRNVRVPVLDQTRIEESSNNSSSTICPICISSLTNPVCTKCGHVFCEDCINRAIVACHKCPLCNSKIFRRHLRRIFF